MTLKTYQATTMAEALAQVKRDLGRNAVILHTRNFRKGGLMGLIGGRSMWEVTASPNANVPSRPVRENRGQTPRFSRAERAHGHRRVVRG
jgi:flagellar biosynthesis protein FlhF